MKKGIFGIVFVLLTGVAFGQQKSAKDLGLLKQFMTGSFDNAEQAGSDSSFSLLKMQVRHVWAKRKDGYWLYAEQANPADLNKPVFQHMFHIYVQDDSTLICQEFEFKEPSLYVGWWANPNRFDSVKFSALSNRLGCEVYLRKDPLGQFIGATDGNECISTIKGASYSTTEFLVSKTKMNFWEKGWNSDAIQVWGSTKGPYIFKRVLRKK